MLLGRKIVARGTRMSVDAIERAMEDAKAGIGEQLDAFARNTIEYLEKEKALLTEGVGIPETRTELHHRHVMVVVRGYDYKADLNTLKPYVREMHPILIGVDGGADAIMEAGFKPDLIIGDMDSVTDAALSSGAELLVHGYPDGRAPGLPRLLAFERGADLIVAVGTHANLIEYLDKGRKGMASSFLVRLKVGPKLVDAKGVSKLYRASPGFRDLSLIVAAGLVLITVIVFISPGARDGLGLILLRLRALIGL